MYFAAPQIKRAYNKDVFKLYIIIKVNRCGHSSKWEKYFYFYNVFFLNIFHNDNIVVKFNRLEIYKILCKGINQLDVGFNSCNYWLKLFYSH